MSLRSWKEQFYCVPAIDVSSEDALAHSARKWEGLRKENLDRHQVMRSGSLIVSSVECDGAVRVDESSCALCVHYIAAGCGACPLFAVRNARCDRGNEGGCSVSSPYASWVWENDPEPMIKLIADARQLVE
jgi:hypothetical protein